MKTFAEYLASLNLDESLLSEDRRKGLMAAWRAETGQAAPVATPDPPTGTADSPFNDLMGQRRSQLDRERAIADACSACMDAHPGQVDAIGQVGQQALAAGWNRERTELELLRRFERANIGTLVNRQAGSVDPALLEISLLKQMGVDVENRACRYSEQQIQRAEDAHGRNGLSLGEVLLAVSRQNGYRGQTFNSANLRDILTYASLNPIQLQASGAVPSTYSVPTILSNVANKISTIRFTAEDQTWRKIVAIGSAKNFHLRTDVSMLGGFEFLDLGKNSEIRHATIGETSYTNQVKTKAIQLGLSREDLVNDDSGALESRTTKMTLGAARTLSKAVWRKLLTAPVTNTGTGFEFHADFKNAGTAALDAAGLKTAMTLWGDQTEPAANGSGPLDIPPKYLIVGSGLRWDAMNLMASTNQVVSGNTDVKVGEKNPFAGLAEVVYSPHVGLTASGGAATRWYLMADPAILATLEVLFLNGNQVPMIETVDMNSSLLGITLIGVYDFGVGLVEPKAAQKNN